MSLYLTSLSLSSVYIYVYICICICICIYVIATVLSSLWIDFVSGLYWFLCRSRPVTVFHSRSKITLSSKCFIKNKTKQNILEVLLKIWKPKERTTQHGVITFSSRILVYKVLWEFFLKSLGFLTHLGSNTKLDPTNTGELEFPPQLPEAITPTSTFKTPN